MENKFIKRAVEAKKNVRKLDKVLMDCIVSGTEKEFYELLVFLENKNVLDKIGAYRGI